MKYDVNMVISCIMLPLALDFGLSVGTAVCQQYSSAAQDVFLPFAFNILLFGVTAS